MSADVTLTDRIDEIIFDALCDYDPDYDFVASVSMRAAEKIMGLLDTESPTN